MSMKFRLKPLFSGVWMLARDEGTAWNIPDSEIFSSTVEEFLARRGFLAPSIIRATRLSL
jgi:hypothetical protein